MWLPAITLLKLQTLVRLIQKELLRLLTNLTLTYPASCENGTQLLNQSRG